MSGAAAREALLRLLAPVVTGAGLDLEDVEVTPVGRRRLVRVVVDRDGGVSLYDVTAVSRAASAALDGPDARDVDRALGGAPYVLEFSSPGIDRPLTAPRHWRRATGRLVAVTLTGGGVITGRVVAVGEDGVTLDTDGGQRSLPFADVATGRAQVEFARRDDPNADPNADPNGEEV